MESNWFARTILQWKAHTQMSLKFKICQNEWFNSSLLGYKTQANCKENIYTSRIQRHWHELHKFTNCHPLHLTGGNCHHSYKIWHSFFFGASGGSRAARIASSNTFFSPFCWQKYDLNIIKQLPNCIVNIRWFLVQKPTNTISDKFK